MTTADQTIRFFHAGALVDVSGAPPTRTVLQWLREDARRVGTKEGCNEGDCGACTVVVGERDAAGDGLALRTVNACLQLLPTLHGKVLYTVEDLRGMAGGALHPVQQALVDSHGSQCGFCTPGFVMSLWHSYERHMDSTRRPTRRQLADAIAGNLCRCTGYRPILDAAERMFDLPAVRLDTAPALAALDAIHRAAPESPDTGLTYAAGTDRYHAPTTVAQLADLRLRLPDARLLAGGTDIGIWINKQFRPLPEIISVGDVAELRRVDRDGDQLTIGAGASLEAAWGALTALHPTLTDVWLRFASPPIRHAGTLGGNVANGSPIGDGAPVLMALDASLTLRRGAAQRSIALSDFYLGYMRNALQPGEFVERIEVPAPVAGLQLRAYKLSKRYDSDISAVCAALAIALDDAGFVAHVRLAYGGMAATVQRAVHAEAALIGRAWTQATLAAAQAALAADFTPVTDMRASADYRLQTAAQLLHRFWLETRADDPLPPAMVNVWAALGDERSAAT